MTDKKKDRPFVFVRCMTFNHEAYIKDALNGFAMQQTNFPFVVGIIDDASTDNTETVINEFVKDECIYNPETDVRKEEYGTVLDVFVKDNPNCIFHIVYLNENHYGKKSKIPYFIEYENAAKYVAYCEGDDYWTDPLKLQKQVDFLEANPDYGTCCHRFSELNIDEITMREDHFNDIIKKHCNGLELNKNNYLSVGKLPQILTVIYRQDILNKSRYEHIKSRSKYDQSLFYALVQVAPIWIMNENMGVYRRHQGGVATSIIGSITASKKQYLTWKDIYEVYQTEETKLMYINNLNAYIYRYVKISSNLSIQELISLIKEIRLVINTTDLLSLYLKIIRAYLIRLINKIKS